MNNHKELLDKATKAIGDVLFDESSSIEEVMSSLTRLGELCQWGKDYRLSLIVDYPYDDDSEVDVENCSGDFQSLLDDL